MDTSARLSDVCPAGSFYRVAGLPNRFAPAGHHHAGDRMVQKIIAFGQQRLLTLHNLPLHRLVNRSRGVERNSG